MATPVAVATILSIIAHKALDALLNVGAEKTLEGTWEKLQGDKVQNAFKLALGEAIHRYATTGTRFSIAEPLLDKNGLLTEEVIIGELAQILRFDREPNYELIGDRWKAKIRNPPQERNFTLEAQIFIRNLSEELQASEVFGPVFDSKSLKSINVNASLAAEALVNIESQLSELISMMNSQFHDLMRAFAGAKFSIQEHIRDFTWYIDEKAYDFVGRRSIFEAIEQFMRDNTRGYYFIKGDPGIGKTALGAEWVKLNAPIHHFNIRPLGINRSAAFLESICSQLIAKYKLEYSFLHPETTQDAGFLIRLLTEVSNTLQPGERVVLFIDALDEVDDRESTQDTNLLFLPTVLPKGTYIIATARRTDLRMRIDCEQQSLAIEQDSSDNIQDIYQYIQRKTGLPGLQEYITAQEIDQELFIEHMTEKSQGNFMYLRHVLPEIERGTYKDLALTQIPLGLLNYYEDHWRRIRARNESSWLEYKLPIIIALSIVKEPVPIDLISEFSKVQDRRRINSVLHEWQQFLYEQKVEHQGQLQRRYRLYHDSFREFIASKDEVEGEHVSLKAAHGIIANSLLAKLFDDEKQK